MKNTQVSPRYQTTDFLIYTTPKGDVKIEAFLHDENVWLLRIEWLNCLEFKDLQLQNI
ncbi:MAG: hypothetical protein KKF89_04600 [Nanoarchaeota archaeon]|nr:hypothetical protein [Nanoarchaeota archaeon]